MSSSGGCRIAYCFILLLTERERFIMHQLLSAITTIWIRYVRYLTYILVSGSGSQRCIADRSCCKGPKQSQSDGISHQFNIFRPKTHQNATFVRKVFQKSRQWGKRTPIRDVFRSRPFLRTLSTAHAYSPPLLRIIHGVRWRHYFTISMLIALRRHVVG